MKKITFSTLRWVLLLVCLPLVSACDWEDLPAYEEAEISASSCIIVGPVMKKIP